MGASILFNAKCSRPSVCNAVECVLVHRDVAADFWKKALPLLDEKGVELRADPEALEILGTRAVPAEDSDWDAEFTARFDRSAFPYEKSLLAHPPFGSAQTESVRFAL